MNPFTASTMRWLAIGEFSIPVTLTLVHFLWQGMLFGLVALVCDRCLRAATARTRYAVLVTVLLAMGLAPPVTFWLIGGRIATSEQEPAPMQSPARPVAAGNVPAARPRLAEASVDAEAGRLPRDFEPIAVPVSERVVASSISTPNLSRARGIAFYAPFILMVYLIGAVLMLARLTVAPARRAAIETFCDCPFRTGRSRSWSVDKHSKSASKRHRSSPGAVASRSLSSSASCGR